jgi:F0F1-type ATP synthase delta subunit
MDAVVASIVAFVGALAFVFRLEGRVITNEKLTEQKFEDLKEFINERFNSQSKQISEVKEIINGRSNR